MKILVALATALLAMPALAADQLHLYNWNNYIAPETVKRFEALCKCEVVQTYYSDNDELLAKLAAGARGYDVMVPTSNAVQALIRGNQLLPLDQLLKSQAKSGDVTPPAAPVVPQPTVNSDQQQVGAQ